MNKNILLIIATLIVMYLLFNNSEKFTQQHCIITSGTACNLGNRPYRCGSKCCKCKCNSNSCK